MAKYKDMTNQDQFTEELDKRGIDYDEDTTSDEMVEKLQEDDADKEKTEKVKEDASSDAKLGKKTKTYYWVKMTAHVDENNRVPAGLYEFEKANDRLDSMPISVAEKFKGGLSERAVVTIAEDRGMKFHASDDIDYEDLFNNILNDITYV